METTRDKLLTYVLTPLSWLYGLGVYVRNKLFDNNILRSEEFDIPVVSVGNITVGGTGKTPHVEFIVSKLSMRYNIAVISRGYKRKTKGFILANTNSSPETIGDEPYQIYNKFGNKIKVAVSEDRCKGIRKIKELFPEVNLILLDDAFQHRFVKPKVSILLIEYNRPVSGDKLLPLGRLRESEHAINRADMVIVTKCPETLQPLNYRLTSKGLQLMAYQKLFFSRYEYGMLQPVYPDEMPYDVSLISLTPKDSVLLLTGIARPRYFVRHFNIYDFKKKVCYFPDHHDFDRKDMEDVEHIFERMKGEHKIIVTTEKDAVRLAFNPYFPDKLKKIIYFLPVSVKIGSQLNDDDFIEELNKEINRKPIGHRD